MSSWEEFKCSVFPVFFLSDLVLGSEQNNGTDFELTRQFAAWGSKFLEAIQGNPSHRSI